jgi:hypothetical protein
VSLDWNASRYRPPGHWPPPILAKIRGEAAEERDRLERERRRLLEEDERARVQREKDASPVEVDYDGEPAE